MATTSVPAASPDDATGTASSSSSRSQPANSPHLRFRTMSRPPTISEEDAPRRTKPASRRASSFMSDSSFDRSSLRSSTNDLLRPRPDDGEELHEEPSLWNSLPLAFALIPAVGGVLFKRGAVVVTDIILLGFAAIYLNWCLVTPWYWYHSAQTIKISKPPITQTFGETTRAADADETEQDEHNIEAVEEVEETPESPREEQDAALRELQLHEITALACCFAGPLVGAYILHLVRRNLSDFADDLVSGLHLTLFVLAAELRPLRYCLKMVQARTIHLQRVVREDPHALGTRNGPLVADLEKRLAETEQSLAVIKSPNPDAVSDASADLLKRTQVTMQSQIDALNRAVRRYEKRATAQTLQNEARLQDLEHRLRDALSLAAAAASYGQEPGVIRKSASWGLAVAVAPFKAMWASVSLPFRLGAQALVRLLLRLGLIQDTKKRRPASRPKAKGDRPVVRPMVKQR